MVVSQRRFSECPCITKTNSGADGGPRGRAQRESAGSVVRSCFIPSKKIVHVLHTFNQPCIRLVDVEIQAQVVALPT
jgi:hypothetical protein